MVEPVTTNQAVNPDNQYQCYTFPDGSIYYGETALVNKDKKIIANINDITDENAKKEIQTVRHGYGIMLYDIKDENPSSRYEGMWFIDRKKGKGKAYYVDGSSYEGEFDNDLYDGNGKFTWKPGYYYNGQWCQGRMEGEGELKHYEGHVIAGYFNNNYYYLKMSEVFINPFISKEERDTFILKNLDFKNKSQKKFDKFSRDNLKKVTSKDELISAIEETYEENKIPLLLRSTENKIKKAEMFDLFRNNYCEIDLRYCDKKLHETSLGLNTKILDDIKQNVVEAMTKGLYLILNFDDCQEDYSEIFDPDIREFYGNMMLSKFMWNPELFFSSKCSSAHLCNRPDLKLDKNFKFITYSKFFVDEKIQEHDLLNDIEKRFEKCFPLVNMNILIYSQKKENI